MRNTLCLVCLLIFASCGIRKAGGRFTSEDGYRYYVQSSPSIRIRLYGDYQFHALTGRYFPEIDKSFLKHAVSAQNKFRPRLMYAAHTNVQPFYSTIASLYKKTKVDAAMLAAIKTGIGKAGAIIHATDTVETPFGTATRFRYRLQNAVTQNTTSHLEYLVNGAEHSMRLLFWTTAADTSNILHESETIVKNIRQ